MRKEVKDNEKLKGTIKNYFANTKEDIYEMKINRCHKNLFMSNKEDIYVMKVSNDFNRKEVDYVARRPAPNFDRPRRSARFWSSRRPHRGALGEPLTGPPTGGGVLRWELERALISRTTYLRGHTHATACGSRNLLSTAQTNSSSNYLLLTW